MPCPSISLKYYGQLDQIILWLIIIKSSSKNCCQVALYYQILPPDGTLVANFARTTQYSSKETILTHYAHIWVGLASGEASTNAWQIQFQRWVVNSVSQYLQDNFHQRKKVANFLPSFFSFLEHKCNGFKTSLLKHFFHIWIIICICLFWSNHIIKDSSKIKGGSVEETLMYMFSPYSKFEFSFLSLCVYLFKNFLSF